MQGTLLEWLATVEAFLNVISEFSYVSVTIMYIKEDKNGKLVRLHNTAILTGVLI